MKTTETTVPKPIADDVQQERPTAVASLSGWAAIVPYLRIMRVDHWFKNVFMLLGVLLAYFIKPDLELSHFLPKLLIGFISVCLIASSNYVINEVLDARSDRFHPKKRHRSAATGKVRPLIAYIEWAILAGTGFWLGAKIGTAFCLTGMTLWAMGIFYNVRPIRTKDVAYIDVLSESINNPLRLFLGWFVIIPDKFPPVSLFIAYWMFGAFFMALKRFAEYRSIGDSEQAALYRKSFKFYNDERLLVSAFFYAIMASLFAGVFIVRYHVELILLLPFAAFLISYYLRIGLQTNSPVQNPEKLYREWLFTALGILFVISFVALMLVRIPALYEAFNIREVNQVDPLWSFGKR